MTMLTIGHSTLPIEIFLEALRQNGCSTLVDVRSIPRSRHNPQYEQPALFAEVERAGIEPLWRKGLGGLRHPLPRDRSVNGGWRNESFRGYADYMQTEEFAVEIAWLMGLPSFGSVAVMCAEAVPWRCHRSLIGDAVLARGGVVEDIFVTPAGKTERRPHTMTRFARVEGTRVWYPAETPGLFDTP